MKILICTSTFHQVTNGPAKFARLLFAINETYPEHEVKVITEDQRITRFSSDIFLVKIKCPRLFQAFIQIFRMWQYHQLASRLRSSFPFDILLYTDAVMACWSGIVHSRNYITIGMLNDDDNVRISFKTFGELSFPPKIEPVA